MAGAREVRANTNEERATSPVAIRRVHASSPPLPSSATYGLAVGAELAAHRALDRLRPPSRDGLDSLTVMVKTFERPAACRRLLDSIERLFPGLRVIVVDDSRSPVRHRGVETVVLPFDVSVQVLVEDGFPGDADRGLRPHSASLRTSSTRLDTRLRAHSR